MRYTGTGTGTIGCGEYTDPNYFPDHKNDFISTVWTENLNTNQKNILNENHIILYFQFFSFKLFRRLIKVFLKCTVGRILNWVWI